MIEVLPPLGKYKYDTWRILPVKCYIDNSVRLQRCIRNVNKASLKDPFPLPRIEQVVDLTTRCELLSFLDA
jgi:hypothetical protein